AADEEAAEDEEQIDAGPSEHVEKGRQGSQRAGLVGRDGCVAQQDEQDRQSAQHIERYRTRSFGSRRHTDLNWLTPLVRRARSAPRGGGRRHYEASLRQRAGLRSPTGFGSPRWRRRARGRTPPR